MITPENSARFYVIQQFDSGTAWILTLEPCTYKAAQCAINWQCVGQGQFDRHTWQIATFDAPSGCFRNENGRAIAIDPDKRLPYAAAAWGAFLESLPAPLIAPCSDTEST